MTAGVRLVPGALHHRGFTLTEVLVALAVLMLTLPATWGVFRHLLVASRTARRDLYALCLLDARMAYTRVEGRGGSAPSPVRHEILTTTDGQEWVWRQWAHAAELPVATDLPVYQVSVRIDAATGDISESATFRLNLPAGER